MSIHTIDISNWAESSQDKQIIPKKTILTQEHNKIILENSMQGVLDTIKITLPLSRMSINLR